MTPTRILLTAVLAAGLGVLPLTGTVSASSTPPDASTPPGASDAPGAPATAADALAGFQAYLAAAAPTVFENEDALEIADCPVVSPEGFTTALAGLGVTEFDDVEGEFYPVEEPELGAGLTVFGVECDFDVPLESPIRDAQLTVFDLTVDAGVAGSIVESLAGLDDSPTPASDSLGGEFHTGCFEDSQCVSIWNDGSLLVSLTFEFADATDEAAVDAAFAIVLPEVFSTLAAYSA